MKALVIIPWCALLLLMPYQLTGKDKPAKSDRTVDAELHQRAEKIHRRAIVIDAHIDIPSIIAEKGFDIGSRGDEPGGKIRR